MDGFLAYPLYFTIIGERDSRDEDILDRIESAIQKGFSP